MNRIGASPIRIAIAWKVNRMSFANAVSIEHVDLSPIALVSATFGGRTLSIDPPLVIQLALDETKQLYVATDADLGLHALAYTRDALVEEIHEQLLFLWHTYASDDPIPLTPGAHRVRDALHVRLSEVI
jgi:hypothetical protein